MQIQILPFEPVSDIHCFKIFRELVGIFGLDRDLQAGQFLALFFEDPDNINTGTSGDRE